MFIEYNWQITPLLLLAFMAVWSILLYKRKLRPNLIFVTCLLFSASSMGMVWWYNQQAIHVLSNRTRLKTTVAFSPKQGATNLVVTTIQDANKYIYVAAYSFTSKPIAKALFEANKRGVDVKIVLDNSQKNVRGNLLEYFKLNGMSTRINSEYKYMHNKYMVIDGVTLQLGSFNYTTNAEENNAENVLVINNDVEIVSAYLNQWQKLWSESKPLN